jgi:hypothetical protein
MRTHLSQLLIFLWLASPAVAAEPPIGHRDVPSLQALILPGEKDSQWLSVDWMPAGDIWAARQKAAAEGKPLFLWYMAGEPLGPC